MATLTRQTWQAQIFDLILKGPQISSMKSGFKYHYTWNLHKTKQNAQVLISFINNFKTITKSIQTRCSMDYIGKKIPQYYL